jgi:hypothetical protein
MFTLNSASAHLTLGENITIQGRTTAGSGRVVEMTNGTFNMNGDSTITGHVVDSVNGAVHINGSSAVMNMYNEAAVTGNRTTQGATATGAIGGVRIATGTLTMNDRSHITGNRHGSAETGPFEDVFVNRSGTITGILNMNGNSEIGTIILEAIEGDNSRINFGSGFNGKVDTIHLRSAAALTVVERTAGFWLGKVVLDGPGAAAAVANVTLGNFRSLGGTPNFLPVNPYTIADSGTDIGSLTLESEFIAATVRTGSNPEFPYPNFDMAIGSVNGITGSHTITLIQDRPMTRLRGIGAGVNIEIVGAGGMRTITHDIASGNSSMLFMDQPGAAPSLTLGNNITIQGRAVAGAGRVVEMTNGTFNMNGNSRITGHVLTGDTGVVTINRSSLIDGAVAVMNMSDDAIITGNRTTAGALTSDATAGVRIIVGTLTMNGQSQITDNRHGAATDAPFADVYVVSTTTVTNTLNMNGSSRIGALILNAQLLEGVTASAQMNVGPAFTGGVDALHLRGDGPGVNAGDVNGLWTGRNVLTGSLSAPVAARFTPGNFRSQSNVNVSAVSATHMIDAAGVLRLLP